MITTENCKEYRKKGTQPMMPWVEGLDVSGVSISVPDQNDGSPKEGDMIAISKDNPADRWLVAAKFFNDNYEKV